MTVSASRRGVRSSTTGSKARYVFVSDEARQAFQDDFEQKAAKSAGSKIIGSAPMTIEACEIIGVVRGPAGFRSAANFERARPDDD